MRTTVTIDDDVYEAARVQARASGNTLGRVLSDLARKALGPAGRRPRFASFELPEGARPILATRVQAALDGDGIL